MIIVVQVKILWIQQVLLELRELFIVSLAPRFISPLLWRRNTAEYVQKDKKENNQPRRHNLNTQKKLLYEPKKAAGLL